MRQSTLHAILDALWPADLPSGIQVMAVLDGAQDDVIYAMLRDAFQEKACLFGGDLPWPLPQTAPYLVQLERDDRLTRYLLERGWGRNWGFFLRSPASIKGVSRHLRHFLLVRNDRGQRLVFRFFDPRILRHYLPLCSRTEIRTFLGPSWDYLLESADGSALEQFRVSGDACDVERFDLAGGRPCEFRCPPTASVGTYVPPPGANIGGWRITSRQIESFQNEAGDQFHNRLVAHLRAQSPEWVESMSQSQFQVFVKTAVDRARTRYGFTLENTIGAFVSLSLELGPEFDQQPAIQKALSDPAVVPDSRFDRLFAVTTATDWLEALRLRKDGVPHVQ